MLKTTVIVLGVLLCISRGYAQPKITSVEGNEINFGDAFAGTTVEHKVVLRNTGSDTLRIKNVRAQCGCTATLISQRALGPSDTTSLTITFNTRGFNGKAKKHVYVDSNDPVTPQLTIGFETNVITALSLSPSFLALRMLRPDSLSRSMINIVNLFGEPVKVLDVKADLDTTLLRTPTPPPPQQKTEWDKPADGAIKPAFRASIGKSMLKPGEKTELTVEFRGGRPGNYQGNIRIATNVPQIPYYDVRFFAEVK